MTGPDPIGVVVFTGGPRLQRDAKIFIERLEGHPEIYLRAVFCQSGGQGVGAVVADLWRRRRLLALPLLALELGRTLSRHLTHPSRERRLNRTLRQMAERVLFVPNIHATEVLDAVRGLEPDLGLIYGGPVLEPRLFEIPALGTLGIHHGKLPEYRGKKTTFWAIFNGEPTAGVTIQRVNRRIDAGEIVKEREVVIGSRSLGSVWRELETLGYELYIQAVLELRLGTATYRPPSGAKHPLYRDPKPGQLLAFAWRQLKRRLRGG